MIERSTMARRRTLGLGLTLCLTLTPAVFPAGQGDDVLRSLQQKSVDNKAAKVKGRPYHFGSQGPDDVFSNHASHSNRLIPVYIFGRKADLGAVTGANSAYRDPAKIRKMYGTLPANTLNPDAEYADQSDLAAVQLEAVKRGAKYVFTVWFDGLDWDTTRAAAIVKSGKVYNEGKGAGLIFQDETAEGSAQFGFFVTSPTHEQKKLDVDAQTVTIPTDALSGGYDAQLAGATPWSKPIKDAPGYLKGQSANKQDKEGVEKAGGVLHAYTDSAPSAAEYASGVKSYNDSINVNEAGEPVETVFQKLQGQGWKVGTVTSVPFDHASPAAMYAHNVLRDDYQDLAREMLGLESIVQKTGKGPRLPGLDVVIGTGFGKESKLDALRKGQGKNAEEGNIYLAPSDRKAIDVRNGGKYVVAETTPGVNGGQALRKAARQAVEGNRRLFGFYGSAKFDHLPYRTADGRFDPVDGLKKAEEYTPSDLEEQPTLADMTEAALTVLSAEPGKPFSLFVEAGDVDFGLHDNNLDNAVGAIYSGEAAIDVILKWIKDHSNWDESVLIVTADHGHYLVVDDPKALVGQGR